MLSRRTFLKNTGVCLAGGLGWATGLQNAMATAAEPAGLVIDTHQHLWDLEKLKLPWLSGAPEILKQTYHLKEYAKATAGLNVKAVYMEVYVDPALLVDEAEHVLGLCREGTATVAAVIGCRPESPEFSAYLKRFQDTPQVKGMRRILHEAETPAGFALKEPFVKSVRMLGERKLSFDLCLRPMELDDGVKLAELCPDTRMIVDHCGNADPKAFNSKLAGDEKPWHEVAPWKRGIEALAKKPNTICKISGAVARLPKGGDAGDLAPIVNHCLDTFGPDRVVFGSDWPVCLLGRPLAEWVSMLTEIVKGRSEADRKKLWSENAVRLYGLKV